MHEYVITWFEIPSVDFQRACDFYAHVLQKPVENMNMPGITMGMIKAADGVVTGAVVHHEAYKPTTDGPGLYLWVADGIDAATKRVEEKGGRLMMPKMHISEEIGWAAWYVDSEGNKIALHSMAE